MLQAANGNWSEVELKVKKTFEKQEEKKVWGKYVTQIYLEGQGWTSDMITNSKKWAESRGLLRTSEIHGGEEWQLPLDDEFSNVERNGEKYEAQTSTRVQDRGFEYIYIYRQMMANALAISRACCS